MGLKELLKKISFWKKEKKSSKKIIDLPRSVPEVSIKFEPEPSSSYPYPYSTRKEMRVSTIRAKNEARNPHTKSLRGMPKKPSPHQERLWNNKGPIEPEENLETTNN
jgi:hypothetical protein